MFPIKVSTDTNSAVWQVSPGSPLVFQREPVTKKLSKGGLIQVDAYVQTNFDDDLDVVKHWARSKLNWEYDCGFGIFGKLSDVTVVFNELREYMCSTENDSFFLDDLMEVGAFTQLVLMHTTDLKYAFVQGGAYLQKIDSKFKEWLESFNSVQVLWAGPNYGILDDGSPFEEFHFLMEPLHVDYREELEHAQRMYAGIQAVKPEVCKTLEAMWSYIPKK